MLEHLIRRLTRQGICSYFVLVMPEPYWPKRKGGYRLADAEEHNRYAAIWCPYCKRKRYFLLSDLRIAFGNIECDDVVYQDARWRCTGCNGKHTLQVKIGDPPADETVVVRRLERVEYVRRPIWRDEQQ